jgi:hypothetical protein
MIRWFAAVACVLVIVIPFGGQRSDIEPVPALPDVFDGFADSYRQLLADAWQEFADTEFASDEDALSWINDRNKLAHKAAFAPVHDRAAAAADQGPEFSLQFATDLREGTLR